MCRKFIKRYFNAHIVKAYDALNPGAYKADLWRCCVLYVRGGVYMDIKLSLVKPHTLDELINEECFVSDRLPNSCFNAFLISRKHNKFLLATINRIVENVNKKYYGVSPLSPTGPLLMGALAKEHHIKYKLHHFNEGGYICNAQDEKIISTEIPEWQQLRKRAYDSLNTKRYDKLWLERDIYTT